MKNQYFGDVNDYHKYAFIRHLLAGTNLKLLVAWMLTKDDKGRDGKKRNYSDEKNDPELYSFLKKVQSLTHNVALIEKQSKLLPNTSFHSKYLKDDPEERSDWWTDLMKMASKADLIFLDPDNGFEVKSVKKGRKRSSKYIYWDEIEALWADGKSLLVYQHWKHEKREVTEKNLLARIQALPGKPFSKAFPTSNVLYLLAAQKKHEPFLKNKLKYPQ